MYGGSTYLSSMSHYGAYHGANHGQIKTRTNSELLLIAANDPYTHLQCHWDMQLELPTACNQEV